MVRDGPPCMDEVDGQVGCELRRKTSSDSLVRLFSLSKESVATSTRLNVGSTAKLR